MDLDTSRTRTFSIIFPVPALFRGRFGASEGIKTISERPFALVSCSSELVACSSSKSTVTFKILADMRHVKQLPHTRRVIHSQAPGPRLSHAHHETMPITSIFQSQSKQESGTKASRTLCGSTLAAHLLSRPSSMPGKTTSWCARAATPLPQPQPGADQKGSKKHGSTEISGPFHSLLAVLCSIQPANGRRNGSRIPPPSGVRVATQTSESPRTAGRCRPRPSTCHKTQFFIVFPSFLIISRRFSPFFSCFFL